MQAPRISQQLLNHNRNPRTEMEEDHITKENNIDIVLWTLSRALRKQNDIDIEEVKDDDDEEHVLLDGTTELTTAGYSMASLLGLITDEKTDLESVIESQVGLPVMPFPNMDRSGKAVCLLFNKGLCPNGNRCHLRHLKGEKTVVCKHWLRGLCKKGDDCEFLHEYDLSKMPECFFFSKYNACSNKECPFRHIDPESKIKDCPWYDRGFCRHGPYCKYRHRRRIMCEAYMVGFCPEGPECPHFHPPNTLPPPEQPTLLGFNKFASTLLCHNCHERGHKANTCPHLPSNKILNAAAKIAAPTTYEPRKQLSDVVCFKCGTKGHYANRCTMNSMSFLRSGAQEIIQDS